MRKLSRTLTLLLCAAMALSTVTISAAPATVTLRIEGVEKNLLFLTGLEIAGNTTVFELVTQTLDRNNISYEAAGGYFSQIAGDAAEAFGGWDGWVFYINGKEAAAGMMDTFLNAGDEVLVCYADPYGDPPTLLPQVSAIRSVNNAVTLTVTAEISIFSEDGTMRQQRVAVEEATLTVDGKEYVTDKQGCVYLSKADSLKRNLTLQISKKGRDGKPLVVRFAPGHVLDLPPLGYTRLFSDITPGAWYEASVYLLVELGAIDGYADNTFRPTSSITRAEFIKVLASIGKADTAAYQPVFIDVPQGAWYASFVTWAAENGIISTDTDRFYPNSNLTREDMAVMLARFNASVLKKSLPQDHPAPTFTDEAEISTYAAESIYLMQRAGIIDGMGDGRFAPKASAQRSAAAKMIAELLNLE